jgi:hypothetical protein
MRESVVEDYLGKRVRSMGGEVRKAQWIGRRGCPDRLVLLPGRAVWVELKRPGEVPEPHQLREHERLRLAGMRVEVIDTLAGVDAFLETV